MADAQSRSFAITELCADQQRRWQAGEPVRVESYLASRPDLAADSDDVVDLIYNEVFLRERRGEQPTLEEYQLRFPALESQLRDQFAVHRAIVDSEVPTDVPLDGDSTSVNRAGNDAEASTTDIGKRSGPHDGELPRVAGYELLAKLGQGAMGVVYRAVDLKLKRDVALKMIGGSTTLDRVSVARFLAEAEVMAAIRHPHVVQVYESGEDDGRPFMAMEYVAGGTLASWLKIHGRLAPRQAAELIAKIAAGVSAAHDVNVVHRDLKPGNILLNSAGEPKVTDFGLAKRTVSDLTGTTELMGTPAYMSPEQAGQKAKFVSPATDVWAIGVIFYECLTGKCPFEADATDSLLAKILLEPPRSPRRLVPGLPRDLELVCLKCLEKDPRHRYRTAGEVADDLAQFLSGRGVSVRPIRPLERLRRWCRRNPALASATGLAVAALLAVTTISILFAGNQARSAQRLGEQRDDLIRSGINLQLANEREAEQRIRAEAARDRAWSALDSMTSAVTGDSLATQKEISDEQKKFLSQVLKYYQEFAREKADDESSRVRTALAAHRVGFIEYRLGRTREAATAIELARSGYEKLAEMFPAVSRHREDLATCHNNLGLMMDALGASEHAAAHYRDALSIQERLVAETPDEPKFRLELARSHFNLGTLLWGQGKLLDAEQQLSQALAAQEKLAAKFPTEPVYRQEQAASQSELAIVLKDLGRRSEAEKHYRQALAIQEKLAADFPGEAPYREELATNQHNLGTLLHEIGNPRKGDELYLQAQAIQEKLVATFPSMPTYRRELAATYNSQGAVLKGADHLSEAEERLQKSLALRERLAAEFPADVRYSEDLANSHHHLALVQKGLDKPREAEAQYRKALGIQETLVAKFPLVPGYRQDLAHSAKDFADLLSSEGKRPEAEERLRKAIAIQEKLAADFPALQSNRRDLALSDHALGILLSALQKWSDAETLYRKAQSLQEKLVIEIPGVPFYRQELVASHFSMARLCQNVGRRPEAEEQYHKALAIQEELLASDPKVPAYRHEMGRIHNNFGLLLVESGKPSEAEEHYRKAISVRTSLAADFPAAPEYQIELAGSSCNFANLLCEGGQPSASLEWFAKAIRILTDICERNPRPANARQFLRNSHMGRALAYDRLEKFADAVQDWDRVVAISPPQEQSIFRAGRARARARAGLMAEAVADVVVATKIPSWAAGNWYEFACVYAAASRAIAGKQSEYANRAMELLEQSVKSGYNDAKQMRQDPRLEPIRGRDDFKTLLDELAKKAPAKPSKHR